MDIDNKNREQVENCVNTTFGTITQPFIRATFKKKKTSVLALLMFYETRAENIDVYSVELCYLYHNQKIMSVLII